MEDKNIFLGLLDSLHSENKKIEFDLINYNLTGLFTIPEIKELSRSDKIFAEKIIDSSSYHEGSSVFALPENMHWTLDNMGPFIIPKKGLAINLTSANYTIYRKTILKYEQVYLSRKSNIYFINGRISKSYTFKENYCFLMGDNRNEARDSRYIGFIPESNIVGKSQFILFSEDSMGFNWNRFMKRVL